MSSIATRDGEDPRTLLTDPTNQDTLAKRMRTHTRLGPVGASPEAGLASQAALVTIWVCTDLKRTWGGSSFFFFIFFALCDRPKCLLCDRPKWKMYRRPGTIPEERLIIHHYESPEVLDTGVNLVAHQTNRRRLSTTRTTNVAFSNRCNRKELGVLRIVLLLQLRSCWRCSVGAIRTRPGTSMRGPRMWTGATTSTRARRWMPGTSMRGRTR